jgi:hypothetical protein
MRKFQYRFVVFRVRIGNDEKTGGSNKDNEDHEDLDIKPSIFEKPFHPGHQLHNICSLLISVALK